MGRWIDTNIHSYVVVTLGGRWTNDPDNFLPKNILFWILC